MFRWAEEGEIQEQRLVAPLANIGKGGVCLVCQGLATGWGFGALEEQASREDPVRLEASEVNRFNAGELNDSWHVSPFLSLAA
jgi:hypothetical protein